MRSSILLRDSLILSRDPIRWPALARKCQDTNDPDHASEGQTMMDDQPPARMRSQTDHMKALRKCPRPRLSRHRPQDVSWDFEAFRSGLG